MYLLDIQSDLRARAGCEQGTNARKINCSCVYSAYILKPVLWADLYTRIDGSVFV